MIETAKKELPFTFDVPKSHKDFLQLVQGR